MENCVFCKIIKGEIKAVKLWEDDKFVAILDAYPNTSGMTLVLTREHYGSDVFDLPAAFYSEFLLAGKKVAKMLEIGLDVKRVALVAEGTGVNHAHLKLYPLRGLTEKFQEIWMKEQVFFEKYNGYLSTQLGPPADPKELERQADTIKEKNR
jgi:histidine triad (HIT) family protein